jgi:hypothetical protein
VVVHAAGMMILGPIAEFDLDVLDRMSRTNIRGTFVVNQQAARRVRAGGAIINFSSSVKKVGLPTYGPYAATKGAVDAISPILARELSGRDVDHADNLLRREHLGRAAYARISSTCGALRVSMLRMLAYTLCPACASV